MENLKAIIGVIAAILLLIALAQQFLTPRRDAREPPFLYPKVPIFGHLLGLITQGADYFHKLESRYHKSVYTLPILTGRMYLVTSPEWAQAVHKSPKSIYFNTLVAQAMKTLFLMDDDAMKIINQNLNNEDGTKKGLMIEIHDMMFATLGPGAYLDDLNRSILDLILPDMNNLARTAPTETKLWLWLRHRFAIASADAIWGRRNPLALHSDAEPAFWDLEAAALPLTMMPYPQLLARKGYNARKRLCETFEEYVEKAAYNDDDSSQLTKTRAEWLMRRFGLSRKMYAWGEVSLLFGVLSNTIPAAFWLISWIFEDAKLLDDIRVEVDNCVTASSTDASNRTINATKLRTACPLLASTFRETLRLVGAININRYVAEDTTLTNSSTGETYALKKDSVIQIASNVIHARSFWGSDAATFNPRRFMATSEKARNEGEAGKIADPAAPFRGPDGKIYSSAFRSLYVH